MNYEITKEKEKQFTNLKIMESKCVGRLKVEMHFDQIQAESVQEFEMTKKYLLL